MTRPQGGFSMMEMMVAFAAIAILALMAAPSFQGQIVRNRNKESPASLIREKSPQGGKKTEPGPDHLTR